jgi:hypothetical protein
VHRPVARQKNKYEQQREVPTGVVGDVVIGEEGNQDESGACADDCGEADQGIEVELEMEAPSCHVCLLNASVKRRPREAGTSA